VKKEKEREQRSGAGGGEREERRRRRGGERGEGEGERRRGESRGACSVLLRFIRVLGAGLSYRLESCLYCLLYLVLFAILLGGGSEESAE